MALYIGGAAGRGQWPIDRSIRLFYFVPVAGSIDA